MEFHSESVRRCNALFHTVGYGDARQALLDLVATNPEPSTRVEVMSLLLRVNIERDEMNQMEEMTRLARELKTIAQTEQLTAALYHLGIVFLLADNAEEAGICFSQVPDAYGAYRRAAVLHKRRESDSALMTLRLARTSGLSPDLQCLMLLLEGNCLKGLGRPEEALASCQEAQRLLPLVKTFYLKHWVFFGLATAFARKNERSQASMLFEVLLSITHPIDFKRLHRLASDELARLFSSVEVLFDSSTGDIICGRGYLSLRKKPTLIGLMRSLIAASPEVISKESIYQQVWHGEYHPLRHDGLIYSHMQRLRQILSSDKQLKDFILTTPEGYRLNPEIRVKIKEEFYETPNLGDAIRHSSAGR